jgi:alpha-N-acetylglucosamine transferase
MFIASSILITFVVSTSILVFMFVIAIYQRNQAEQELRSSDISNMELDHILSRSKITLDYTNDLEATINNLLERLDTFIKLDESRYLNKQAAFPEMQRACATYSSFEQVVKEFGMIYSGFQLLEEWNCAQNDKK